VSPGANQFDRAAGPSGCRALAGKQAALIGLRWVAAATIAAVVHFAVAWAVLNWREADIAPDAPPAAVMIDLAPLPAAPRRRHKTSRLGRR
jgi:glycerol dehydrogenase-like iron-containing ADH family enzyme